MQTDLPVDVSVFPAQAADGYIRPMQAADIADW